MTDPDDPKGLIRESYRIEGITAPECRSILVDWALSLAVTSTAPQAMARLHLRHASGAPDHPMTTLLAQGAPAQATRRGGRTARLQRRESGDSGGME